MFTNLVIQAVNLWNVTDVTDVMQLQYQNLAIQKHAYMIERKN